MDSEKQREFSPAQKVYRPSLRRYLKYWFQPPDFLGAVIIGLTLLIIPITTQPPEEKIHALFICLLILVPVEVFFVFYLLLRARVRLVISGDGIGYSTVGYRIFTPWDNVAGFGVRRELLQSPSWIDVISGLELHQPAPIYKAHPLVRLFLWGHQINRPSFFIPVSNVIENWQHGEVAEAIQRYAPGTLQTRSSELSQHSSDGGRLD